jgi:hypothetical protein
MLVRAVALVGKAFMAVLMVLAAATVIATHYSDQRQQVQEDRAARLERERLAFIASQARELSASSGRSVAKEFVEATGAASLPSSPETPAAASVQAWRQYLPDWWDTFGIVAVLPLAGLAVHGRAQRSHRAVCSSGSGGGRGRFGWSGLFGCGCSRAGSRLRSNGTGADGIGSDGIGPDGAKSRSRGRIRLGFSGPRQPGASVAAGPSAGGGRGSYRQPTGGGSDSRRNGMVAWRRGLTIPKPNGAKPT